MNLQDKHKTKGLAFLPALFLLFFACEEPSELGVELNPKEGKISTHYIEIPVEATQVRIDTVTGSSIVRVLSTNRRNVNTVSFRPLLLGKTTNPAFGTATASIYSNINVPADTLPVIPAGAGVDSVILRLNIRQTATSLLNLVGDNFAAPQDLYIYRLEKAIAPTSGSEKNNDAQYRYFTSEKLPYTEEVGHITFTNADLEGLYLTIKLNPESAFATEILNQLTGNKSVFEDQEVFNNFIHGLAIIPGENNTFINSYYLPEYSYINFYYGGLKKPVTFKFSQPLNNYKPEDDLDHLPVFTSLETDFKNSIFENAPTGNNVEFQNPDNQVYYRSGVGLFPKFNFPALKEFANLHPDKKVIINKATLVVDSVFNVAENSTFPLNPNFHFVDDENNKPVSKVSQVAVAPLKIVIPARINSAKDTVYSYSADLAAGVEYFMKTQDDKFLQGIPYPAENSFAIFDFIADPKRIKLKIYYTVLED